MIINATPYILRLRYDLTIYRDTQFKEPIFTMFPKLDSRSLTGIDALSEDIREFVNKEIDLKAGTYDQEISFDPVSNLKFLIFKAYYKPGEDKPVQPDIIVKFGSKTATPFRLREFTHLSLSEGIEKIYVSNELDVDLSLFVGAIGDKEPKIRVFPNTYVKDDVLSIFTITHNLGVVIPQDLVTVLDANGSVLDYTTDYTFTSTTQKATFNFVSGQGAKVIVHGGYVHTQGASTDTWTITHGLDRYPKVFIYNGAGTLQTPTNIVHTNENSVVITLGSAITGKAILI